MKQHPIGPKVAPYSLLNQQQLAACRYVANVETRRQAFAKHPFCKGRHWFVNTLANYTRLPIKEILTILDSAQNQD